MLFMKNDRSNQLPKAREDQLIVKELPDETLVYDLSADKAHCLNHTAGLVWKYCDGKSSVSEIAASLGNETQTVVDDRIVWLALDQLEKFKLLAEVPTIPAVFLGLNRRQLIRTLGVAAVALPVIMSISAPTAQAQASPPSCLGSGSPCSPTGIPCCAPFICRGSPKTCS
jgi:hypothetical protein